MDEPTPGIFFDEKGRCNFCLDAESMLDRLELAYCLNDIELAERISRLLKIEKVKYHGILGLSGGLDSTYLIEKLYSLGFRPLVVHVDAGWNTVSATRNISRVLSSKDLELETVVVDWESIRRAQISYLKSGLRNQDVPQDHAFFASLYRVAEKKGISTIFSSESILPSGWGYSAMDGKQVRAIMKRFSGGTAQFPIITKKEFHWKTQIGNKFKVIEPLNWFRYSPSDARSLLESKYNWIDYGGKHRESYFTSFFQEIYLPERFGIWKQKAHLSSLIVSKEITRLEALEKLSKFQPNSEERLNILTFISQKLEISIDELEQYINMSEVPFGSYPNDSNWHGFPNSRIRKYIQYAKARVRS
jgi:glutaredoxin